MGKKSRASKQKNEKKQNPPQKKETPPRQEEPPEKGEETLNLEERGPEGRCWDWMIVCGDSHYARNRASLVAYHRIARRFETTMLSGTVFVEGVGTVELRVRSGPEEGAPTRTLVLENVLHVPNALCNGFAMNVWFQECGGASLHNLDKVWAATDKQKQPYWYGERAWALEKLALAGNPQGESYLDDGPKFLSMYIDEKDLKEIRYGDWRQRR